MFEFLENSLYNEKKVKELISVEKKLLNSPQHSDENADSSVAEMFLNYALLEFKRAKVLKEIDQTLQDGNKELFLKLTEELKKIS
ncbi:IDEAL domain-containing protein [Neobacillus soli]|uniref:IDEAL domain-containing protein n=1 Tax=Neobacillus soli TaxID=220688 RepID=UPI001FD502D1|nr:IDEAL domain-containing protein [Neobacillus soli]